MPSGHTGLVSTGLELSGDQREINGHCALHMALIARKADVLPPTALKAYSLANHWNAPDAGGANNCPSRSLNEAELRQSRHDFAIRYQT